MIKKGKKEWIQGIEPLIEIVIVVDSFFWIANNTQKEGKIEETEC